MIFLPLINGTGKRGTGLYDLLRQVLDEVLIQQSKGDSIR